MEREPQETSYQIVRSEHAGNVQELRTVLSSMLEDSADVMTHDGLFDIVVRDAEGNEYSHHIAIPDAITTDQARWSENDGALTVRAIAARYERDLHAQGLPGGNPHPIDVTVELRRESDDRAA